MQEHTSLNDRELHDHLNRQTAKIHWPELERAFAQGLLLVIDSELDLIETAIAFIRDDKASIEQRLAQGDIARVEDAMAQQWAQTQASFWAVVVAPWVLVQPVTPDVTH